MINEKFQERYITLHIVNVKKNLRNYKQKEIFGLKVEYISKESNEIWNE